MPEVVVVLGSGPSLGFDQFEDLKTVRESGLFTIAVNTTWKKAPWCNVIFAGDTCWWRQHGKKINSDAERWTHSNVAAEKYNARVRPRKIRPGYNSGACAIELAANVYKAKTIILLGFDCSIRHGIHHHGKHKRTGNPDSTRCKQWIKQFKCLKAICKNSRIINCSRYTELDVFEKKELSEVLQEGCFLS